MAQTDIFTADTQAQIFTTDPNLATNGSFREPNARRCHVLVLYSKRG